MPRHKDQHYVPRFYLKNFANNKGKINILNLKNYKINNGGYKNQCQEDYFYGKELTMEHFLHKIEDHAKAQIENMVNTSAVDLEDEPYLHLMNFIAIQSIRTKIATDSILENVNSVIDAIIERLSKIGNETSNKYIDELKVGSYNPRALITLASFTAYPLLLDLLCVVIENESPIDFITSDNPVCLYNQYLNDLQNCNSIREVFSSKGLIILYPISYKKLMILFDPSVYEIENWSPVMTINNAQDVEKINICQCVNANKVIFFSESVPSTKIVNWVKEVRNAYEMKYGILKSTTNNNNNTRKEPYKGNISFIKLQQKYNVPSNKRKFEIRNEELLEIAEKHHRELLGENNIPFQIVSSSKK